MRDIALRWFLITVIAGCLSPSLTANAQQQAQREVDYDTIILQRQTVPDAEFGNRPAFSVMMPMGWRGHGEVEWNLQSMEVAWAKWWMESPDGNFRLEQFPQFNYSWMLNAAWEQPVRARDSGNYTIVLPVCEPSEFVTRWVMQAAWRQNAQNIRITNVEQLPIPQDLQQFMQQAPQQYGARPDVRHQRVRVSYTENGRQYEEAFTVLLTYLFYPGDTQNPFNGQMMAPVHWQARTLFSVRAPAGQLDAALPMLTAIHGTFRYDPQWYHAFRQVWANIDSYRQRMGRQRMMAVSRILSETSSQISDSSMQAYRARDAASDRAQDLYMQSLNNTTTYANPFDGSNIAASNTHNQLWVSENGMQIMTNDALYDPRQDPRVRDNLPSVENWQQAERRTAQQSQDAQNQ
jgi:hypothetical protein